MEEQINARCTKKVREMASERMDDLGFSSDSEYIRHLVIQDYEQAKGRKDGHERAA